MDLVEARKIADATEYFINHELSKLRAQIPEEYWSTLKIVAQHVPGETDNRPQRVRVSIII